MSLTPAQKRILEKLKFGPTIYSGRHARPIDALKALGLVAYDWKVVHGPTTPREEYRARLTRAGREAVKSMET